MIITVIRPQPLSEGAIQAVLRRANDTAGGEPDEVLPFAAPVAPPTAARNNRRRAARRAAIVEEDTSEETSEDVDEVPAPSNSVSDGKWRW